MVKKNRTIGRGISKEWVGNVIDTAPKDTAPKESKKSANNKGSVEQQIRLAVERTKFQGKMETAVRAETKLEGARLKTIKAEEKQIRDETKRKKKAKKKFGFLKKKFQSKPILKKQQVTIKIKEHEPAPNVARFFQGEREAIAQDRRQFFFK